MILFFGIPSEPPMRMAIDAAVELAIPHVVLNQRQLGFVDAWLAVGGSGLIGCIDVGGVAVGLSDIDGVYFRTMNVDDLPETRFADRLGPGANGSVERARVLDRILLDWLELASCRVVNRPSAMGSNVSKPYQQQLIAAAGFATPATIVTNRPDDVAAFIRAYGRVVYKSVSSVRSIVHEWRAGERSLEAVGWLPTQFQELVEGSNVRVHVVGRRAFAVEIASDTVDYRYSSQNGHETKMERVELPIHVARRCIELTATLGLAMSGIDLIRRPDGSFVCLEVNPSPAYTYFEQAGRPVIAPALVRHLAQGLE